ncbi:MAG: glucose-1-phosphate adenylyltransferase subunit GlgD [Oscillospiraceae bacterium]
MGRVLGLIFANMHDNTVTDLTKARTMGSILFAGRYRLIDFTLSNMVNSGLSEVGVITKANYQSLLDHLGSAREWDLSRKKGGLHILPPFGHIETGLYRGRIEALYGALSFIRSSLTDYVIMSDCDVITNFDYRPLVKSHIKSGADITIATSTDCFSAELIKESNVLSVNPDGKITDILISPKISGNCTLSLNTYVMNKKLLVELITDCIARSQYSFERDILQAKVGTLNIHAYDYAWYYSKIHSMKSYFEANMELLNSATAKRLFLPKRPIYTKVRDNAPSRYGLNSMVKNSLVADGCVIEGVVENSILFRGVKVGKGAVIRDSIIMQDTAVGAGAELSYVITDKNVKIAENRTLTGADGYPTYIAKFAVV